MGPTASFRGERFFLSNMFSCNLSLGNFSQGLFYHSVSPDPNFVYTSSEQAFQCTRTMNQQDLELIASSPNAFEAKKRSKGVHPRPDWNQVKVPIMVYVVYFKFSQNEELTRLLLNTMGEELIEGNNWKDSFWGVDLTTGKGQNHLGRILMLIREFLNSPENRFNPNLCEMTRFDFDIMLMKMIMSKWNLLRGNNLI